MQLHEQYRPTEWADLVAGPKLLGRLEHIRGRGLAGRSYWISGLSGTGKTTIASLIAREIASEWCTEEHDASELTAARVRELERQSHCLGLGGKPGRAYIVNEAHGLHKPVVRQLLTTLERVPSHVVWVFTTTDAGQQLLFEDNLDASPLVSRCVRLEIAMEDLEVLFARRARAIAKAEGIDSQPLDAYLALVREHKCNLRAVLQEVEAGAMVR